MNRFCWWLLGEVLGVILLPGTILAMTLQWILSLLQKEDAVKVNVYWYIIQVVVLSLAFWLGVVLLAVA